jgi:hypothetical protein
VLLGNVRPCPPPHLASIIPPAALQQQQQQQGAAQLPPAAAAAAWAASPEGLFHLAKLLRPGLLLEYRSGKRHRTWLPALLLHSSLLRPPLSSQLQQLSLQHSTQQQQGEQQHSGAAGGGRVTAAGLVAAVRELAGSSEQGGAVPACQAPQPEDRVLTLQLLGGTRDVSWALLPDAADAGIVCRHRHPVGSPFVLFVMLPNCCMFC